MQQIILVTINDRADFGKKLDREAFATRQAAEAWGTERAAELLARSDDPDYCDPVADFETVWLTPMTDAELKAEAEREAARAASARYNLDNASD